MEYNTQKYQFDQDGRDYAASPGLVSNRLNKICLENLALNGPFYPNCIFQIKIFILDDLRHVNHFIILHQIPEGPLLEIRIELQKLGL